MQGVDGIKHCGFAGRVEAENKPTAGNLLRTKEMAGRGEFN